MLVVDKPIYVTSKGLVELDKELAFLRDVKRPDTIERMQDAKGGGDWMDQTEYMLIEEELAFIDSRILEIQHIIDEGELIGPGNEDNVVNIGETVVIQSEDGEIERFTIVGVAEVDPAKGFISNESPLGRAVLSRKVGEEVVVDAPAGEIYYRILGIKEGEETI
jgi:transcription elongation factor GreA